MSGKGLERLARGAAVVMLVASGQFVAALLGGVAALLIAMPLGVCAMWLWMRFELTGRRPWMGAVAAGLASLFAILLVELLLQHGFVAWFAPLLAAGSAWVTWVVATRTRVQCGLCNRRLLPGSVSFRCPRCTLQVCDETCWNFEHRRCRLCLEQRVPVLPAQESWWTRVSGPRARLGRCQMCLAAADAADLRLCPHCRRPQCRDCWDFNNGECARCAGALPDLPASLTMAVAHLFTPESTSRK